MPKAFSILAGFVVATALTFQTRVSLISTQAKVQQKLDDQKIKNDLITSKSNEQLEGISLKRPTSSVEQFMDNTTSYYKHRFVPSVKESWNNQIICATRTIIQSDLPRNTGKFIAKNIFGSKE